MSKAAAFVVISLTLFAPGVARAHCDTLDGPVVETARKALETGQLNPVLAWVRPADEAEIRAAFTRAVAVRKAGPEARQLADTWFFETLVRVHRAGEGAPYTGLKAAGQDLGPAVPAADKAIEKGSPDAVERLLVDAVRSGLRERYARVMARKPPAADVAAGRAWVEAYVPYVHYAEGVFEAARGKLGAHPEPAEEAQATPAHAHEHGAAHQEAGR
jgi:hypothetical protein